MSLFPFLDVLSGVVGILTLIIVTLAVFGLNHVKKVVYLPSNPNDVIPTYVECRKNHVIIHPNKTIVGTQSLLEPNSSWLNLLTATKNSEGRNCIELLIREDGVNTFEKVFDHARSKNVEIGYDVIVGNDEIEVR